jgi:hypothetical protein
VLGRKLPRQALRRARLYGRRRAAARGVDFPIVLRCRGGAAQGCVLARVTRAEHDRLADYEGAGYDIGRGVAVLAGRRTAVRFFAPRPGAYKVGPGGWSLARWRRRGKPAALAAAAAMPPRGTEGPCRRGP